MDTNITPAPAPAPKDHVITWQTSEGVTVFLYGDGYLTEAKDQALRFTRQDAKLRAQRMADRINPKRVAEGLAPLTFSAVEA